MTRAPAAASARAVARPMPREAPVTSAVLLMRSVMAVLRSGMRNVWKILRSGLVTKQSCYKPVLPPLTLMIWPVMNDALLEATNTMVSAISSGRPARFSGTPATRPAFRSALPVKRSSIAVSIGPGVVDGDVEAAEPGDRPFDQVLDVAFVANVGADEFRFGAKRAQLGDQRFADIIAAAGNDDAGALLRESERGGAADAGQRAGDQYNGMAHLVSPSMPAMPVEPCDEFRWEWLTRRGWRFIAALEDI